MLQRLMAAVSYCTAAAFSRSMTLLLSGLSSLLCRFRTSPVVTGQGIPYLAEALVLEQPRQ